MSNTVLVTGGTGTFGHAFTVWTLANRPDAKVRLLSRGEAAQVRMRQRFSGDVDRLTFIIGDIRDRYRLVIAMHDVDVVIHAAAMKQVPLIESDPLEAIKTNVMGTVNVIEAAIQAEVGKVVLISSDKAVSPVNCYGATKLVAEKVFQSASAYTGGRGRPEFAVARYGNVLGSRGSVIETWREQASEGSALTITNPHMTRFIITPSQAAEFVWFVMENMQDGCIYAPAFLPAAKIGEMAKSLGDYPTRTVGSRFGEKLHEELISEYEWAQVKPLRREMGSKSGLYAWEINRWAAGLNPNAGHAPLSSGELRADRYLSAEQICRLLAESDEFMGGNR